MPDIIPAWLSAIISKEPTVKIMMTIVIFLVLVTFVPLDLFPDHPMPAIPYYFGMFAIGFLISHVFMIAINLSNSFYRAGLDERNKAKSELARKKEVNDIFESLTSKEVEHLSMAIDIGSDYLVFRRGEELAKSLTSKGLISHRKQRLNDNYQENFYIKKELLDECYMRYAGYYDRLDPQSK